MSNVSVAFTFSDLLLLILLVIVISHTVVAQESSVVRYVLNLILI